jgi:hypothetical protein
MKKLIILAAALALSGCATIGKTPVHVPHHAAPKPVVKATPIPPPIAAPLVKPRWYDRFRHKNGKLWH